MSEARPLHLRLPYLGLTLIGGSLGTAAREAISLAVSDVDGIPVAIFGINILGAFCLGLLLSALSRMGPDVGMRQKMRILIGTGFMGGFTTYSALAADAAQLLGHGALSTGIGEGRVGAGLLYGLVTVVIGGLATWAGIALASARRRNAPAGPSSPASTASPETPESLDEPISSPEPSSHEGGDDR